MTRPSALLLTLVLASCATVSGEPRDLGAFIERRAQCDHWRGEDAYDAERAAEIARNLRRYCDGTDAELARLKQRYADDPSVMTRLLALESKVE